MAARGVETHVLPLLAAGRIRVPVAARFSLDEVAAAYDAFAAGGKFGKIVVVP
jgi:NADPH:quinone reductase-like Zn-dependent oxidoreductase